MPAAPASRDRGLCQNTKQNCTNNLLEHERMSRHCNIHMQLIRQLSGELNHIQLYLGTKSSDEMTSSCNIAQAERREQLDPDFQNLPEAAMRSSIFLSPLLARLRCHIRQELDLVLREPRAAESAAMQADNTVLCKHTHNTACSWN